MKVIMDRDAEDKFGQLAHWAFLQVGGQAYPVVTAMNQAIQMGKMADTPAAEKKTDTDKAAV